MLVLVGTLTALEVMAAVNGCSRVEIMEELGRLGGGEEWGREQHH
jgi:hypothetical protein